MNATSIASANVLNLPIIFLFLLLGLPKIFLWGLSLVNKEEEKEAHNQRFLLIFLYVQIYEKQRYP